MATHELWARIGILFDVTDDQLYDIMAKRSGNYDLSAELSHWIADVGHAEGDSYIPGCILDDYREWYEEEKQKREAADGNRDPVFSQPGE